MKILRVKEIYRDPGKMWDLARRYRKQRSMQSKNSAGDGTDRREQKKTTRVLSKEATVIQ